MTESSWAAQYAQGVEVTGHGETFSGGAMTGACQSLGVPMPGSGAGSAVQLGRQCGGRAKASRAHRSRVFTGALFLDPLDEGCSLKNPSRRLLTSVRHVWTEDALTRGEPAVRRWQRAPSLVWEREPSAQGMGRGS